MTDQTESGLPEELLDWAGRLGGGNVAHAVRRPGGARKEAWFVDVVGPTGVRRELFLRYERTRPGAPFDPWSLRREANVYMALQGGPVPVPHVLGVHPEYPAMLAERLVGENWFSRITDPTEATTTARSFIASLSAQHRIDPSKLHIDGFPKPTSVPDLVDHELDEWEEILRRRGGEVDPALTFVIGWLRRNVPDYTGPVVLVQGDTGPGNFMFRGGRVVAVVDWELAHFGDPMDDIAWLTLRCTQEPLPDLPALLREYEHLSGHRIDEGRVRYYQVAAETKLQVMNHYPGGIKQRYVSTEGGGSDVGNGLIYGMLHRRLWLEALGAAIDLELDPPEMIQSRPPADHDWLYEAALLQLRDVIVPRITDPLALTRGKALARILKYLAAVNLQGGAASSAELDDLAALLGSRPDSVSSGRDTLSRAVAEGAVSDRDYLQFLWRRAERDNQVMGVASGALAQRHWPALS